MAEEDQAAEDVTDFCFPLRADCVIIPFVIARDSLAIARDRLRERGNPTRRVVARADLLARGNLEIASVVSLPRNDTKYPFSASS